MTTGHRNQMMRATLAVLALLTAPAAASAAQVTIRMKGGGLEMKGELRSFDGTKYVIEAPQLGLVTFDAHRIECIGEACTQRVTPPSMPYEPLSPAAPETITISGGGAGTAVLMPALIRGYAAALGASVQQVLGAGPGETRLKLKDASGAELATFVLSGAPQPLDALKQGSAQIALTERPMSEAEAKALAADMPGVKPSQNELFLATDGLAIIVSPDNPALALGEDALARIFSGKAASWIDVGVGGGRLTLYAEKNGSALQALQAAFLKPRGMTLGAAMVELASEGDAADAVTRDPNGIAVVSFAETRNARRLNVEGACGIITKATPFTVKAGEWPLTRKLYATTLGAAKSAAARDLIRYAVSKEAQAAIADALLVDNSIDSLSLDEQTGRMAAAVNAPPSAFDMGQMRELLDDLKNARRLSLTFRFVPGTTDLDANSRRDVQRLAELMLAPANSGKSIALVGFSDADGKFSTLVGTTAKRAGQVRNALLAATGKLADPARVAATGHGPLAPVACNDTSEHRLLNRRVEAWLR